MQLSKLRWLGLLLPLFMLTLAFSNVQDDLKYKMRETYFRGGGKSR
jgi:hypothetical protein